ncbi:MAG: hypothetical protein AABW67_01540 [Nanoarchaeota archaeon]
MKLKQNKKPSKLNYKVIIYSIIGLASIALTFLVDWAFILIALIMIWLNNRELKKKQK